MPKFYLSAAKAPCPGEEIEIAGDDARHIGLSLRAKTGERLAVCCGGCDCDCEITAITPQRVRARVVSVRPATTETRLPITVFLALLKGEKFEMALQKSVELGAAAVVPVLCERCVSRPDKNESAKKVERWAKIAAEAGKQSGRAAVVPVSQVIGFAEAAEQFAAFETPLFFYENAEILLSEQLKSRPPENGNIAVFTGPEGGFSAREVQAVNALAAGGRLKICSLGARILRAETAPLAVLGALNLWLGEF